MTVAIKFLTEYDGKALAKGEKGLKSFASVAKKVGLALGVSLSARALVQYSKKAVQAFADDEKAAKSLAQTLKNTGNSIAGKGANSFIDQLQRATGVADDSLRPALQNLLNSTGDYALSQKNLNLSLDIAAGTTKDVISVSAALAKAYAGNTTALSKLGTGISKATLASGDMVAITATLQRLFSGQAATAADTFSGKMARLNIASQEASETIGGALAQSFVILAGTDEIGNATKNIDGMADALANLTVGLADWFAVNNKALAKSIAETFGGMGGDFSGVEDSFIGKIALRGQRLRSAVGTGLGTTHNQLEAQRNLDAIAKAERAAAAKRAALDKKAAAAKAALDKKAAADKKTLSKGNALFDLEKIGVEAALKMSIDKETRLRLELLQAIQLEDADKILAKMIELENWQKTSNIAKLSGITTISEKQLSAINTTLLAELDAISKSKMSDAEKSAAQQAAWTRYNDAIKYAGGLAALSTYSQKLQDQELLIQRLASIATISAAQTAADNIKQAALDKYLATLEKPLPKGIAPELVPSPAPIPPVAAIPPVIPPVAAIPPALKPDTPFVPLPGFPGIGSDKGNKDNQTIPEIIGVAAADAAAADAAAYAKWLEEFNASLAALAAMPGLGSTVGFEDPTGMFAGVDWSQYGFDANGTAATASNSNTGGDIVLNFNAPITTTSTEEFAQAVQTVIQNQNRYGNNLTYAGQII